MNAKKWVLTFLLFALVLVLGLAAFNYVTDPFAAFGDKFLNWFSYESCRTWHRRTWWVSTPVLFSEFWRFG